MSIRRTVGPWQACAECERGIALCGWSWHSEGVGIGQVRGSGAGGGMIGHAVMDELDVVAVAAAQSTRVGFAGAVLPALTGLLNGESGSYVEVPLGPGEPVGLTVVRPQVARQDDLMRVWADRHGEHPWLGHVIVSGLPS